MKKILIIVLTLILVSIGMQSFSETITEYEVRYYNKLRVSILKTNSSNIYISSTLKGYRSGINGSFFNMNTLKTVPVGLYNRPFIIFNSSKVVISDNVKDISDTDKTLSAGSWLIKDSKVFSTNDHFTKSFKSAVVSRTCFGLDGKGNVLLVTIRGASLYKASIIMKSLGCVEAISLDGGTSSTMKYNGKIVTSGKRRVVNYIVID
jgi:hypothetical protein